MKHFITTVVLLLILNSGFGQIQFDKQLSQGWNWFSLNVIADDMSINSVLSSLSLTDGDYIKSRNASATYYEGTGWFGDLSEFNVTEAYKIKLAIGSMIQYEGQLVDHSTNPITINIGWNWIGYIPQGSMTLDDAMTTLDPAENDYIKSQSQSATQYNVVGWFGDLSEMRPGEGYMIKSDKEGIIVYPEIDYETRIAEQVQLLFPEDVGQQFLDDIDNNQSEPDYDIFVVEYYKALESLSSAIEEGHSADELKEAILKFQSDFANQSLKSTKSSGCDFINLGLGYAKGVDIKSSLGGSIGVGIKAGLEAQDGGGIEIVYDFVNLTSQVYIFTYCGIEAEVFGVGLAAALSANMGFKGHCAYLFNIPYTPQVSYDLFASPVITSSFSISADFEFGLGISAGVEVAKSSDIDYDCDGAIMWSDCFQMMEAQPNVNGITTLTLGLGGSVGLGIGGELGVGLSYSKAGSCRSGIRGSFKDYTNSHENSRKLAAIKMATSILSINPSQGLGAGKLPTDKIAAAAALVYGNEDILECMQLSRPSVITKDLVIEDNIFINTGGNIIHDGNSEIIKSGVLLGNKTNPDLDNTYDWEGISIDTGEGYDFTSSLMGEPGKTYYIVAFAKNMIGTSYGNEFVYTIPDIGGEESTFTDPRDGNTYEYKTIGTQTWMIENLAYLPSVSPSSSESISTPYYFVNGYQGSTVSEAKATNNYGDYGVLYNWEAAKTACPEGWHLPLDQEWKILEIYLGMSVSNADDFGWRDSGHVSWKLKSTSSWSNNGNGDNNSCFDAKPGGYRYSVNEGGAFSGLGTNCSFWSSSYNSYALARDLASHLDGVGRDTHIRSQGFSVRCLQDYSSKNTPPIAAIEVKPQSGITSTIIYFDASGCTDDETSQKNLLVRWDWEHDGIWDTSFSTDKTETHQFSEIGDYEVKLEIKDGGNLVDYDSKVVWIRTDSTGADGSFTDPRDGNTYEYKTIGTQTWMIENLAYLPSVSPPTSESFYSPYYYVIGYVGSSISEAKAMENYQNYGVLYNWEAAMSACSDGWHLPSDEEWKTLEKFLGMSSYDADRTGTRYSGDVGLKLKSESGWDFNGNGNNSSRFNSFPSGVRYTDGRFLGLHHSAQFWSSSFSSLIEVYYRTLHSNHYAVSRYDLNRMHGLSIRCIKD